MGRSRDCLWKLNVWFIAPPPLKKKWSKKAGGKGGGHGVTYAQHVYKRGQYREHQQESRQKDSRAATTKTLRMRRSWFVYIHFFTTYMQHVLRLQHSYCHCFHWFRFVTISRWVEKLLETSRSDRFDVSYLAEEPNCCKYQPQKVYGKTDCSGGFTCQTKQDIWKHHLEL